MSIKETWKYHGIDQIACPHCNSDLETDGVYVWCVNTGVLPAPCYYGHYPKVVPQYYGRETQPLSKIQSQQVANGLKPRPETPRDGGGRNGW